jgi:hypothetical protein
LKAWSRPATAAPPITPDGDDDDDGLLDVESESDTDDELDDAGEDGEAGSGVTTEL